MEDKEVSAVRVARIGKPHGIRGEVTVEVFTDSPERRFVVGNVFTVDNSKGRESVFSVLTLAQARWNKKILLLKFDEFSDRNTAESLRDAELYAPGVDPLGNEDGWYADDLIGLAVHEGSFDTVQIGQVADLITGEAQDLLVVRLSNGSEVLLPFVGEIVPEIDEEQGAIVITPPPGLLELSQD